MSNIYLNDMSSYVESSNACNFADDITFYVYYLYDKYLNSLINRLGHDRYQLSKQLSSLKTIL